MFVGDAAGQPSCQDSVIVNVGQQALPVTPLPPHAVAMALRLTIDTELEDDGRWIAEIPELPGVMAYGTTRNDAVAKVEALALRVIAERETHRASAGGSLNLRVRDGALRVQSEPMRVKEGRER